MWLYSLDSFFFFNDTATTEIYTLSLHDALPISSVGGGRVIFYVEREDACTVRPPRLARFRRSGGQRLRMRSEEHTSELQSRLHLVCRLLLEKKKQKTRTHESAI